MADLLVSHNATATIASGQTTSNAIEGRHHAAWLAVMPAAFTGTQLSFTTSVDGATYQTLKTTTGTTVTVDVAAATSLPLPPEVGHARWFKIVSNAAEGAARTIKLSGKTVTPAPVRASAGGGAGTEYTEGDTDASITGRAILWEDTGDTLRAASAAKPLPVAVISGGGGGTQFAEDSAHANGDLGTMIFGVRKDVRASNVGTDGDYAPFQVNAQGDIRVDGSAVTQPVSGTFWQATQPVSGTVSANLNAGTNNIGDVDVLTLPSLPAGTNNIGDVDVLTLPNVTNAGTFAVQDSQVVTDNAAFTDGTTKVFPAGYVFDESAGTALTENDAAAARVNANRAQVGVIEDGATRTRYATVTAANALKTDGSAVTQPVSGTFWQATQPVSGTVTANLAAGTNNIGDVDVLTLPSIPAGTNNIGDVDVLTLPNVTNAGTFAVQDSQVVADNAAFTDGTTKLFMGGFIFDEAAGTALTENDAAAARVTANRSQIGVIEDGSTRARYATVKAASTAPVAADTSLVASVSPNSLVAVPSAGAGVASLPVTATAMSKATYVALCTLTSAGALTAATDKQLFSIEHAASATKTVRIHKITIDITVTTAPAAAGTAQVRLYRGTAASSAGTATTPVATKPGVTAAEATTKVLPTITAASTTIVRAGWMAAAAGGFSFGNGDNELYKWDPQLEAEPLTLRAGNLDAYVIAIQHTSTPTVAFSVGIWFTEE